jgi:hypothetical protein
MATQSPLFPSSIAFSGWGVVPWLSNSLVHFMSLWRILRICRGHVTVLARCYRKCWEFETFFLTDMHYHAKYPAVSVSCKLLSWNRDVALTNNYRWRQRHWNWSLVYSSYFWKDISEMTSYFYGRNIWTILTNFNVWTLRGARFRRHPCRQVPTRSVASS